VVTAEVPVPGGPTSVSMLPNGMQAYVTMLESGTVMVLDVARV
jgi:DNA-binding beta-propeller fold protein YncE